MQNNNSRIQVSSNSPLENSIGFSRAVRVGNFIAIAGTAPILPDGSTAFKGDVYKQTKYCFQIIQNALKEAGDAKLENIIRTRLMLTNISDWKEAAKAHGEIFQNIKPACTFVEVSRFINEEWLIEIEADCLI